MAYGPENRQELSIEGRVLRLRDRQLFRIKGDWPPLATVKLLEASSQSRLGRVDRDPRLGLGGRMVEQSCPAEGSFGGFEGRRAIGRPQPFWKLFRGATSDDASMKWDENLGNVGKEPVIKINHPQKALQLSFRFRSWEVGDGRDSLRHGRDARSTDVVAEERKRRDSQQTFRPIYEQAILAEKVKDGPEMVVMFGYRTAGDEEVVQIDKNKWERAEYRIH